MKKIISKNNPKPKPLWATLLLVFGLFAVMVIGFVTIANEVNEGDTVAVDEALLKSINAVSHPTLDTLSIYTTDSGGVVFVLLTSALLAGYLFYVERKYRALIIIGGVGGAALINFILKLLFERTRPDLWQQLVTEPSFSFPSGHAMASSALIFSIIVVARETKWRSIIMVFGGVYVAWIGFTRLYLGVHYPSDVLAGWLISLAWIIAVSGLIYAWKRRVLKKAGGKRV